MLPALVLLSELTAVSVLDGLPSPASIRSEVSDGFVAVGSVLAEDLPLCIGSLCSLVHLPVTAGSVRGLLIAVLGQLSELSACFVASVAWEVLTDDLPLRNA